MNINLMSLLGVVVVLAGCTNESPSPDDARNTIGHPAAHGDAAAHVDAVAGADGCDAIDLAPPPVGQGVQLVTEMTLAPGEERQTCKLVIAGEDINLNYGEGLFTDGSHHATVWRTSHTGTIPTTNIQGRTLDTSEPVDCLSAGDWSGTGVVAAGRSVASDPNAGELKGALPDDVAFKIPGDEVLLLNFHMFNASEHTLHACYKQNLPSVAADQVTQEAGLMFFYNQFVTVPANSRSTAEMACPLTSDIKVSTAVSHMHRRGNGYTATLLDGDPLAGGKKLQTLYDSGEWNEPASTIFKPPLSMKTGQWIRFACDYDNSEQRDIAQGQQTTDEMCMFVGLYWPRNPTWERCGVNGTGRNIGTGTMNGAEFVDCWKKSSKSLYGGGPNDSAARYASQRCVTESCPAVSALAYDYIYSGKKDVLSATCK